MRALTIVLSVGFTAMFLMIILTPCKPVLIDFFAVWGIITAISMARRAV